MLKLIGKLLCAIGVHRWRYLSNLTDEEVQETRRLLPKGGKPYRRDCCRCGEKQKWDYECARTYGRIVWVKREDA